MDMRLHDLEHKVARALLGLKEAHRISEKARIILEHATDELLARQAELEVEHEKDT